jgi:hypothetical protein
MQQELQKNISCCKNESHSPIVLDVGPCEIKCMFYFLVEIYPSPSISGIKSQIGYCLQMNDYFSSKMKRNTQIYDFLCALKYSVSKKSLRGFEKLWRPNKLR